MNSNKKDKDPRTASRIKSSQHLLPSSQIKKDRFTDLKRQENLLHNLLQKKNSSHKGIFTDETNYSYRPEVSNLPFQLYPDTRSQIEISKQKIVQRLIDNMKNKQQQLKLLKLQKEQQEFKRTCVFVPQISKNSQTIISQKLKTQIDRPKQEVFQRLYEEGIHQLVDKQKNYISAQENKLTDQYTFQPQINPISRQILNNESRNLQPIFVRFEEVMEKKRINQKNKQQENYQQIKQMANIKITNKKTLQILEKNQNYQTQRGDVVKRLVDNYFKAKNQNYQNLLAQKEQKLKIQCPFRPKISSNYVLMNASSFDPDQNFFERQNQFSEAIKQNIQSKANELVPTFKPEINKLSQLICKERQYQTLDEKLNRLHYEPLNDKQFQIQRLQASAYKQCKFHPQINQISKALQGPIKSHACKCHPALVVHNFTPSINIKSKKMKNSKSVELQNKRKKEQNQNKIKMEKQYKELVSCTFQPVIKTLDKEKLKFNYNTENLVPGVKEFLDKKNKAMVMKKEDEQYKQKVFNLEKRYKPKTHTTVEQFKLSHQIYFGKDKKALINEAKENFEKEHPFHPNIERIR